MSSVQSSDPVCHNAQLASRGASHAGGARSWASSEFRATTVITIKSHHGGNKGSRAQRAPHQRDHAEGAGERQPVRSSAQLASRGAFPCGGCRSWASSEFRATTSSRLRRRRHRVPPGGLWARAAAQRAARRHAPVGEHRRLGQLWEAAAAHPAHVQQGERRVRDHRRVAERCCGRRDVRKRARTGASTKARGRRLRRRSCRTQCSRPPAPPSCDAGCSVS